MRITMMVTSIPTYPSVRSFHRGTGTKSARRWTAAVFVTLDDERLRAIGVWPHPENVTRR
jgi:hypothetical protein